MSQKPEDERTILDRIARLPQPQQTIAWILFVLGCFLVVASFGIVLLPFLAWFHRIRLERASEPEYADVLRVLSYHEWRTTSEIVQAIRSATGKEFITGNLRNILSNLIEQDEVEKRWAVVDGRERDIYRLKPGSSNRKRGDDEASLLDPSPALS